jgi:tetratricopeptide (TPR) repeat protein
VQQPDARTRAKFDDILTRANSLRLKGEVQGAIAACREAFAVWEGGAEAWELLGDLLTAEVQAEKALEAYRRARELRPGDARMEEKYALSLLSVADQQQLPAVEERLSREAAGKERAKAIRLGILLPGAGHHYLGERTEGLILVAATVIAVMSLWYALMAMAYPSPAMAVRGMTREITIAITAAAVYLGLLVYSVLDVWRLCRAYFPITSPWDVRPPSPPAQSESQAKPEEPGDQQAPPQ